ncbi:hypothetical protein DK867_12690 [Ochrobactrum sp. POC9]|nr:hypothetical protein DK867_12690 [Ochrobactrum sp. POC9]
MTTALMGLTVEPAGAQGASGGGINLGTEGAGFNISGAGSDQTIAFLSGVSRTFVVLGSNRLTFGDANDYTFAGSITGTGGIVKQGSGTQTLAGVSTFTGGLTIAEGAVALGMGGSLSPIGPVNLANAGTYFDIRAAGAQTIGGLFGVYGSTIWLGANDLTFGDATNTAFGGMISGTGGIIKQGTGTAVFTGANIYTGGTTVNGGVLALGAGGGACSNQCGQSQRCRRFF